MTAHQHPANIARHDDADRGGRAADKVTGFMGSWRFIAYQTVIVLIWMALNVTGFVYHWDAYPFILLNLVFSTQAAYASPLILLAGNRAAEHDRTRAETDYATNAETLRRLKRLEAHIGVVEDLAGDVAAAVDDVAETVDDIAETVDPRA